jgi:hypothetical protein
MYSFKRVEVNGVSVHISYQRQGDKHTKKFCSDVTPQTQETLNIYVDGVFSFSVNGADGVVLGAGQTSHDIPGSFQCGSIAVEKVLSPTAVRYCVADATSRQIVDVNGAIDVQDKVVFVVNGSVSYNGATLSKGAFLYVAQGQMSGAARLALVSR